MRRRLASTLLAIALLSLAGRPSLLAQEGPSGTPVLWLHEGVGSANYGYVRLPSDPALPIAMRVVQVTIEPGAAVPAFATTGQVLANLVAGPLAVQYEGNGARVLTPLPTAGRPTEEPAPAPDFTLATGQSVFLPAGGTLALRNGGPASAVLLLAGLDAAVADPRAGDAGGLLPPAPLAGVAFAPLCAAAVEALPAAPNALELVRIVQDPGTTTPGGAAPAMYARLLCVTGGTLRQPVTAGAVTVTRGGPTLPAEAVPPGTTVDLNAGDALWLPLRTNLGERTNPGTVRTEYFSFALLIAPSS